MKKIYIRLCKNLNKNYAYKHGEDLYTYEKDIYRH